MVPPDFIMASTDQLGRENHWNMRVRSKSNTRSNNMEAESNISADMKPSYASLFKTYCHETSLHCFKYLVRPRGPKYERVFWVVQLVIVYCLAALALWKQLLYFYNTPVLITFQPKPTLVSSIPLPAITLCPDMQVRKSFFDLTSKVANAENFTKEEVAVLFLTTTFCDIVFDDRNQSTDFTSNAIQNFSQAHNSYESCKDFVVKAECQWKTIEDPCQYFQPSFSPQGACMSFNLLPQDQLFHTTDEIPLLENQFIGRESVWSMEDGYTEGRKQSRPSPDGNPPWSSPATSLTTYYLFYLKVPTPLFDPICYGGKGFHGYVHNPAEIPSAVHTAFYVKPGTQLNLQVKPKVFTIEEELKSWDPNSKMCYMQNERRLKFFKMYTRTNCEIECETNFTIQKCGCAGFFQPRDNKTQVCGPRINECLSRYSEETDRLDCNCLPGCCEIEYDAAYFSQERNWPAYDLTTEESLGNRIGQNDTLYMSLKMSYRMKFILAVHREAASDFIDLVANVGGLLSLFTGFSILSLVEIFYFFSYKNRKAGKFHRPAKTLNNSYTKGMLF